MGWLDGFQNRNDERDLEKEGRVIRGLFRTRLRRWSFFTIAIAGFVLLNCFVGYSSAPFYEQAAYCNRFAPSPPCKTL